MHTSDTEYTMYTNQGLPFNATTGHGAILSIRKKVFHNGETECI